MLEEDWEKSRWLTGPGKWKLERKTSWQLAKHTKPYSDLSMNMTYRGCRVKYKQTNKNKQTNRTKTNKNTQQQANKTKRSKLVFYAQSTITAISGENKKQRERGKKKKKKKSSAYSNNTVEHTTVSCSSKSHILNII